MWKLLKEKILDICPRGKSKYWDEFAEKGIIAIGWDYLGDLSRYNSREEIREKMIELLGRKIQRMTALLFGTSSIRLSLEILSFQERIERIFGIWCCHIEFDFRR